MIAHKLSMLQQHVMASKNPKPIPPQSFRFITLFLILTLTAAPIFSKKPSFNYCRIKCGGEKHTVCKRSHRCGPVSGCKNMGSGVEFREHMVRVHNEFREKIASGKEGSQYQNIGAKNMNALSYDLEMEYIASCWANMCKTLKHDKCRSSKRFSGGQNIFWAYNSNATERAAASWFGEIKDFTNAKWVDSFQSSNYPKDGKKRGHFTQMIWAKTKYIGCARTRYGKDNLETQLICNYGPAGNVVGAKIYAMAADASQIASECPEGKNSIHPSLCGEIEPIPTEKAWSGTSVIRPMFLLVKFNVILVLLFAIIMKYRC